MKLFKLYLQITSMLLVSWWKLEYFQSQAFRNLGNLLFISDKIPTKSKSVNIASGFMNSSVFLSKQNLNYCAHKENCNESTQKWLDFEVCNCFPFLFSPLYSRNNMMKRILFAFYLSIKSYYTFPPVPLLSGR